MGYFSTTISSLDLPPVTSLGDVMTGYVYTKLDLNLSLISRVEGRSHAFNSALDRVPHPRILGVKRDNDCL